MGVIEGPVKGEPIKEAPPAEAPRKPGVKRAEPEVQRIDVVREKLHVAGKLDAVVAVEPPRTVFYATEALATRVAGNKLRGSRGR